MPKTTRPKVNSSKYKRVCFYKYKLKVTPPAVTWDNSTKGNFAQIQLCPFPLYIFLNQFKVISHLIRVSYLYLKKLDPR